MNFLEEDFVAVGEDFFLLAGKIIYYVCNVGDPIVIVNRRG